MHPYKEIKSKAQECYNRWSSSSLPVNLAASNAALSVSRVSSQPTFQVNMYKLNTGGVVQQTKLHCL